MVSKLWCAAFCCLWEGNKGEGLCVRRKRLDFPVDQVSTLTANCFIIIFCCLPVKQRQAVPLNVAPWLPIYKADSLWYVSFVWVRRLRLDMIGPALFDLLETPPPGVPTLGCVFSQLVGFLWENHAFTSFLVSLLLRCRSRHCSKRQGEGGGGVLVRISGRLWRPWKDTGTDSKPSPVVATTFVHLCLLGFRSRKV